MIAPKMKRKWTRTQKVRAVSPCDTWQRNSFYLVLCLWPPIDLGSGSKTRKSHNVKLLGQGPRRAFSSGFPKESLWLSVVTSGEEDIVETRRAVRERNKVTRRLTRPGITFWDMLFNICLFANRKPLGLSRRIPTRRRHKGSCTNRCMWY